MLDLFKSWAQGALEESKNFIVRKQTERAMQTFKSSLIQEASNLVSEKQAGGGWERTGGQKPYEHTAADQESMLKQCRNAARFDANAKAALQTAVFYIVGEGVKVMPQSKDPRIQKLWREFWEAPRNKMALRFPELVLRTLRDGETLLQFFSKDDNDKPSWKTTVRFRDVQLLTQPPLEYGGPGDGASQGIKVDPLDPEKAISFYLKKSYTGNEIDTVPAEDMLHIKLNADSEQKRGESFLQAALPLFTYYGDWLKYRIILNKVRTAIVMIRKVEGGTSDDVKAIANKIAASSTAKNGEERKQFPGPGTVINASAGVDYRFENANIAAGDASEDGRNIKLGMAAATNMPEYVFGDASNANYASTMIAESPFVKGIRFWQTFFEEHLKEIYRHVIQNAVKAGALQAPVEEDIFAEPGTTDIAEDAQSADPSIPAKTPSEDEGDGSDANQLEKDPSATGSVISEAEAFYKCDVQWPEIVHRDMKETTDAVIAQVDAKLVSESTASQMLGHDYDEEVRRQAVVEEGAENNPFKQKSEDPFADPAMQSEVDAAMNDLTPEEADAILKSGDASSVMQMVKAKKSTKKKVEEGTFIQDPETGRMMGSEPGGSGGDNSGGDNGRDSSVPKDHPSFSHGLTDNDYQEWAYNSEEVNDAVSGKLKVGEISSQGDRISEDDISRYRSIGEKLQSAASDNAVTNGTRGLYRGESYDSLEAVKEKYQFRKEVVTDRLTSTATQQDVAIQYASSDSSGPVKVLVNYQARGHAVEGVQTAPLGIPSNEVVLPKGSKYRVAGFDDYRSTKGYIKVTLYNKNRTTKRTVDASPEAYGVKSNA